MRVWTIAAAACLCGTAPGGFIGFLDVSTGTHDVPLGTEYRYAVARGDAVLIISGGLVLSGFEIEPLPDDRTGERGLSPGSPDLFGSIVATDDASVIFDSGRVGFPVVGAGRSNVWVGPDAEVFEVHARERSVVTVERDEADPPVELVCFESGTLIFRGGECFRTYARDSSSLFVTDGEFFDDLNSFETSRVVMSGGTVRAWAESWDESEFVISDGYVQDVAESNDDSSFTLEGGSVGWVWSRSSRPFVMTGGEVRMGVTADGDFIASGGTIGGDLAVGNGIGSAPPPVARFHVRSVRYDHDADAGTPSVSMVFDEDGLIVIEDGDARLRVEGEHPNVFLGLAGIAVVWEDGSAAQFDFSVRRPQQGWSGRIEFVRSTVPEDLNHDGGIDVLDLAIFLGQFGGTGTADFNGDGGVDLLDLVRFLQAWEDDL